MDLRTKLYLQAWDAFQRETDPRLMHMRHLLRFEVEEKVLPGIAEKLRQHAAADIAFIQRKAKR